MSLDRIQRLSWSGNRHSRRLSCGSALAFIPVVFLLLRQFASASINRPDPIFHLVRRGGFDQERPFGRDDTESERVLLDRHGGDGVNRFELDDTFERVLLDSVSLWHWVFDPCKLTRSSL